MNDLHDIIERLENEIIDVRGEKVAPFYVADSGLNRVGLSSDASYYGFDVRSDITATGCANRRDAEDLLEFTQGKFEAGTELGLQVLTGEEWRTRKIDLGLATVDSILNVIETNK